MTKRELTLEHIRIAAYRGDDETVLRLMVMGHVSRASAMRAAAYGRGQAKAEGK